MDAPQLMRIQPTKSGIAEPYWEGCREGELRLQHCAGCDQFQFYPRTVCSHCGAEDLAWKAVSGQGEVVSHTIVRRGISKAYPAPYVVALIRLSEGPTMMSHVVAKDPETVFVGQAVSVRFESWGDEYVLPVFE